jgi:hypothetical protein
MKVRDITIVVDNLSFLLVPENEKERMLLTEIYQRNETESIFVSGATLSPKSSQIESLKLISMRVKPK